MLLEDRRGAEEDNRGPYIIPITKFVKDVPLSMYDDVVVSLLMQLLSPENERQNLGCFRDLLTTHNLYITEGARMTNMS